MTLCRAASVGALATALLAAGASPAAADHVQPRDISTACPADKAGSQSEAYDDVASNTFAREIACVSDYSIARGRGDGRYVPNGTVTRAQMALFLARLAESARLHVDQQHPVYYSDTIDADPAVREAVSTVSRLGIARGLSAERFGPAEPVTRGQMASFLHRFHGVANRTDGFPAGPDAFDDDSSSVHEAAINAIAAAGIAAGLGGEQDRVFAPLRPLTRGQMAGFLARTLDAEVEAGTIGSTYADRERVEGTVVGVDEYLLQLDTDGDGAHDRDVPVDDNDERLFGETPAEREEFRDALFPGDRDRVRVDLAPNTYDASTIALVDDRVRPAAAVLATAVVGDGGAQDDLRIAWNAFDPHEGLVDRLRSTSGADGRCGTLDDPAYVADGRVDAQAGTGNVLYPDNADRRHPVVVDVDRDQGACYRYTVSTVSTRVPGSTPSEPSPPSNAVALGGEQDTTGPTLTRVDPVAEQRDDTPRVARYTYGNEVLVQPALVGFPSEGGLGLDCRVDEGSPSSYYLVPVRREKNAVVAELRRGPESAPILSCESAFSTPIAVVDEKGNPSTEFTSLPYDG